MTLCQLPYAVCCGVCCYVSFDITLCVCHSLRPWDSMNDVVQYELNMVIQTKTRHQTPIVHTTSLLHVDDLSRGHRRTRSRGLGSSSVHRIHRNNGSSSSECPEMFSAHDLDFSGAPWPSISCSSTVITVYATFKT